VSIGAELLPGLPAAFRVDDELIAADKEPAGVHRDEKTGKGGITPDVVIEVPRETEIKLQSQEEEVFSTKPKVEKDKEKKDEGRVKDEALERALELLKARDILLKTKES
jgi:hypothetical protein